MEKIGLYAAKKFCPSAKIRSEGKVESFKQKGLWPCENYTPFPSLLIREGSVFL